MTISYRFPVYKPLLGALEKELMNEAVDSSWISSKGKFIEEFENNFSEYTQSNHAISVTNGTVALHLALLGAGIGPGDDVLVPSFTYVATVNAIKYVGAKPIFVDVDFETWNISVETIRNQITSNTKAILLVHLYGNSCDLDPITEFAASNNLIIVEDCAEAFGTYYKDIHVGNFGAFGTFSFFGNKTITTGEGGMVVCKEKSHANEITKLKGQGLGDGIEYWHDVIGFNYRMTNVCAAIGVAQLKQAKELLLKKRDIRNQYSNFLKDSPIKFQLDTANSQNSFWLVSFLVESNEIRSQLRTHLKTNGIETRPVFNLVSRMPMYKELDWELPNSNYLAERGVSLPSYPELQINQIEEICSYVKDIVLR